MQWERKAREIFSLDEQKHSGEHLAVNYQDWTLIYYILKTETKSILSACGESE